MINLDSMYNEYFPKIYNFVYFKLLNRDKADDLVSAIFVKVVEKIDSYDETKGKFSTWIFTIARNALIDEFRSHKESISIDSDEIELPSDYDLQISVIKNDEKRALYKLIAQMSQRERSIITMKYFAEMTNREIATELGMNESTVSTVVWRSMQKLRVGMQEHMMVEN